MDCMICKKKIKSKKLYKGDLEQINSAVLGDYMILKGHKICLRNVDDLVVIPNRIRLIGFEKNGRKQN